MVKELKGLKEGMIIENKQGELLQVVKIESSIKVLVRFLSNGYEKYFKSGNLRNGIAKLPKYLEGQMVEDKMGNKVEIVEIKNSLEYLFRWEDGYEKWARSSSISRRTLCREEDSPENSRKVKVGDEFLNTSGYKFTVTKSLGDGRFEVTFKEPIESTTTANRSNIAKGSVKNPCGISVGGVGYLGMEKVDSSSHHYRKWSGMLSRVYDIRSETQKRNYGECSVEEKWFCFKNFLNWSERQVYQEGWELDKDLLVKGNKVYGEDFCLYLPREINAFLTNRSAFRGKYPLGVTYHEGTGKFEASCSVGGKVEYLGIFPSEVEAFLAYKDRKESLAKELSYKWRGIIDPKGCEALERFVVNISD